MILTTSDEIAINFNRLTDLTIIMTVEMINSTHKIINKFVIDQISMLN